MRASRVEVWLKGMLPAGVSGAAGGAMTGLAAVGIDPGHFNLQAGKGGAVRGWGGGGGVKGGLGGGGGFQKRPVAGGGGVGGTPWGQGGKKKHAGGTGGG